MKICICATGSTLESKVSSVFGRAPYFLIFDLKSRELKALPNPILEALRGAGVAASQVVVSEKVEAVIAEDIGPNALSFLQTSGVKTYSVLGLTVKEAIERYEEGSLEEAVGSTRPPRFPPRGPGRKLKN